ncbi:MAG: glycosyltransferase [Candidatus Bathyarchaeota archaeon]|nr:glycosyltransferase [Candidatus Bathyarchaeota archaeon]MDH5787189.1 glycosyltransferase [Candidatus Bathyarchaeota archaeon]
MTTPKVIAVVPVYNGEPLVVIGAIKSLLLQDYPCLRIVVVDDCSKEPLYSLLLKEFSDFHQLTVLRNERNAGFAQTLNRALESVIDETFLLVLEQDCELLDTDYITKALKHFNCDYVGVVSGENLLPPDENLSLVKRIFVNHLCENVHDSGVAEVGFSLLKADVFRIDVLKKVGGFESSAEWKLASEEHIISCKIRSSGYKIIKDSNLQFRAYWGRQEKLWQNLGKEAIYGRGLGWALARAQSDLKIGESEQLKSKRFSRMIQVQYVLLTVFSVFMFLYSPLLSLALLSLTTLVQFAYLIHRSFVFSRIKEKLLFVATGFMRSWIYVPNFFIGFLYGLILRCKERVFE